MTGPWKTSFFINPLPLPGDHNERHRAGCSEDFTGAASGKATSQLTSTADFSEMISGLDYAAAERVWIGPTGVYSLKPWVVHYNTHTYKGGTTTGSRRAEISTSDLDIWGSYNPYYLLELPDYTYILVQIPQTEAEASARNDSVTFPIGQKAGIIAAAWSRFAAVCGEYGAAALLWVCADVGLMLAGNARILSVKPGE